MNLGDPHIRLVVPCCWQREGIGKTDAEQVQEAYYLEARIQVTLLC
ncbi:hypothetical protein JCM19233_7320 [Vibrio astriarenae]|nr:hypothetical protein JCM19233_7320 [Vibrio sp. C7]